MTSFGVGQCKLMALGRGQCCGHEDDRCAVGAEPFEDDLEVLAHVDVGRMHLVDDDDLARQAKVAQHHMLGFETSEQCLVDRADDVVGKNGALAAEEPLVDHCGRLVLSGGSVVVDGHSRVPRHELLVLLVERSLRMGKGDAGPVLGWHRVQPFPNSTEHGVGCGHCGKAEEDAPESGPAGEHLGTHEGRLCFS